MENKKLSPKNKLIMLVFVLVIICVIAIPIWTSDAGSIYIRSLKELFFEPFELSESQKEELCTWLQSNTVKLNTVQPGSGFEDLMPLKDTIGNTRIIALGEAAHLNRDFYKVKHRLVEFLVTEMGFNLFAIESTFAGALQLNDYILNGEGDPQRALAALSYPAWNTEEVLDVVKWMKQYNSAHERKIKFYGFDLKPACGSANGVYDYLKKTGLTDKYDDLLSYIKNPWTAAKLRGAVKNEHDTTKEQVKELIAYLESVMPERSSSTFKDWDLAIQYSRVILQYIEFYSLSSISDATDYRDKCMAENVQWMMQHESDSKAVLWAANAHVTKAPYGGTMGYHLYQKYGDDIMIVALLRNKKYDSESDMIQGDDISLGVFGRDNGTLEAALSQAGLNRAFLNLRSLPKGIISDYFNNPILANSGAKTLYPQSFDAVLFLESTSNAQALKTGKVRTFNVIQQPSNLDFEQVEDGMPKDWMSQMGQSRAEYEVTISNEQPYSGKTCGMVRRKPGKAFHGAFGNICQIIDGAKYSGMQLELSAEVLVNQGTAYLWVSVNSQKHPPVSKEIIINSNSWQEYSLSFDVPPDVKKISFGLAYVGSSSAYIDNIKIE